MALEVNELVSHELVVSVRVVVKVSVAVEPVGHIGDSEDVVDAFPVAEEVKEPEDEKVDVADESDEDVVSLDRRLVVDIPVDEESVGGSVEELEGVSVGGSVEDPDEVSVGGSVEVLEEVSVGGSVEALDDVSVGGSVEVLDEVSVGGSVDVLDEVSVGGSVEVLEEVSVGVADVEVSVGAIVVSEGVLEVAVDVAVDEVDDGSTVGAGGTGKHAAQAEDGVLLPGTGPL